MGMMSSRCSAEDGDDDGRAEVVLVALDWGHGDGGMDRDHGRVRSMKDTNKARISEANSAPPRRPPRPQPPRVLMTSLSPAYLVSSSRRSATVPVPVCFGWDPVVNEAASQS